MTSVVDPILQTEKETVRRIGATATQVFLFCFVNNA